MGNEAFLWTEADGMMGLGHVPGSSDSWARAVSANGAVVVGACHTGLPEAFIGDQADGIRPLEQVLAEDYGLDLTGWDLWEATGISDDGTVIVGEGFNPDGDWEGWVAVIPEPTSVALLGPGGLALVRRRRG